MIGIDPHEGREPALAAQSLLAPGSIDGDLVTCFAKPELDLFASHLWFSLLDAAARPKGLVGRIASLAGQQAALPLWCRPARDGVLPVSGMTSPYTLEFRPLAKADADWAALGAALRPSVAARGVLRMDAIDTTAPWFGPWLAGLRKTGLVAHLFRHFGNWFEALPYGFETWLAGRPGSLRNTIRRQIRRAERMTCTEIVTRGDRLAQCIADFETVYARSWKPPEPHPEFNTACMRALAEAGLLRLGVLRDARGPIAAQYWAVSGGTAYLLKLAYDRDAAALSPGTVLTAQMIRAMFSAHGVTRLDFGRGDDIYKRQWVGERRIRNGVLLVDPRRPLGLAWLSRLTAAKVKRRLIADRD